MEHRKHAVTMGISAPRAPRKCLLPSASRRNNTTNDFLQAKEAKAVTIVGYGNSKNMWNGYAEVELCAREMDFQTQDNITETETTTQFTELPFPEDRKGFNVVNLWVQLETVPIELF